MSRQQPRRDAGFLFANSCEFCKLNYINTQAHGLYLAHRAGQTQTHTNGDDEMKIYNINPQCIYTDSAKVRKVNGYPNRAVIQVTNTMSVDDFYPMQKDSFPLDGSVLLQECMGMDPETFELDSEATRQWVEKWSYPSEMAEAIVAQLKSNA